MGLFIVLVIIALGLLLLGGGTALVVGLLALLAIVTVVAIIGTVGAGIIMVFGDVIVCVLIIVGLVKLIKKLRKRG